MRRGMIRVQAPVAVFALIGALLTPAGRAVAGAAAPSRFALVIGNNAPEDSSRVTLRFADDDAIAISRLLGEAGVAVTLLVDPDRQTRLLNPGIVAAGRPRWSALTAAVESLRRRIEQAARRGEKAELLLFYSGHGDVAGGEGYVLLQDRRLTRTALHRDVLARLATVRNHVIVDACKSFFLAATKGPGGRRFRHEGSFARAAWPALRSRTGYVLSTSSDKDSHEWDRYQAGIFSHELRSALRGAADVNRDGKITYAELGAFLRTANEGIKNAKYRPEFVVRPPGHPRGSLAQPVFSWGERRAALILDGPGVGHLHGETATGERLFDAHPSDGQRLALFLPRARPIFLRRQDGSTEYRLAASGKTLLSRLPVSRPSVAAKGALHLAFQRLFDKPFDRREVVAYERWFAHRTTAEGSDRIVAAHARISREPRRYRLAHEFSGAFSYLPLDSYTSGFAMAAGYTWHIDDRWGVESRFSYMFNDRSRLRRLLENNFGIPQDRFVEIDYFGEVGALFKPAHGRFSLFGWFEVHGEVFVTAGLVLASVSSSAVTHDGGGRRLGIGAAPGFGLRCFMGRHTSLRFDVRQLLIHSAGEGYFPLAITLGLALNLGGER